MVGDKIREETLQHEILFKSDCGVWKTMSDIKSVCGHMKYRNVSQCHLVLV